MNEYISREEVLEHSEYTENFNLVVPVRFIKAMKAADVQPLSVVAKHIKSRLYETALNTNGAESDTIAAMAERIDFWINELRGGDTNG